MERKCKKCLKTLPITEFYTRKDRPNFQPKPFAKCKRCCKENGAEYRKANSQKRVEQQKVYRENLSEEIKRERYLKQYFNITVAEFDAMLGAQGGVCAVCTKVETKQWHIDHDHNCCPRNKKHAKVCGKCIRGILCQACNKAIGFIGDDPMVADEIASYLRNSLVRMETRLSQTQRFQTHS